MKKQIISIFLCFSMALIFTGCGSSNETSETVIDPESVSDNSPIKSGTYEIDGISVTYYDNVQNDVTGNWRLGVIYDNSDLNSYVVDYYNYFCQDDSEVHGIVNLELNTTTLISRVMSDTLDISITEYLDGEEHDAKLLYSGNVLEHYWINMDTLETESIE